MISSAEERVSMEFLGLSGDDKVLRKGCARITEGGVSTEYLGWGERGVPMIG